MGLINLSIKEYKENIFKLLLLLVVSGVLFFVGLLWFAQREIIYGAANIIRAYGLEDTVFVCPNQIDMFTSMDPEVVFEDIGKLESVENVKFCDYNSYTTSLNIPNSDFSMYLNHIPEMNFNPYRMTEGTYPVNKNEVMVSSNASLPVGSEVVLGLFYMDSNREVHTDDTIKVKVTGKFDLDSPMPFSADTTFEGERVTYENDGANTGYAFAVELVSDSGELVTIPPYNFYLVTPKQGYDTKAVVSEIKAMENYDNVTDYDMFVKQVEDAHKEDMLLYRTLSVAFIAVMASMIVSFCFVNLSMKKREMAIYYVSGLPWRKVVGLFSYMNLVFVVGGIIAGLLVYLRRGFIFHLLDVHYSYLFNIGDAVLLAVTIICSYLLFNTVFYFLTCRKTPISLLRTE